MAVRVQQDDFDVGAESRALQGPAVGAIALFVGTVRSLSEDDIVTAMTLEHYPGMTEKKLQDIVAQAESRWPLLGARIIHRIGELHPGDQIVMVATASSHRHAAFEAAEFIMDYLKSHAPFWKKQSSATSSDWISSRSSDGEALKRWQD